MSDTGMGKDALDASLNKLARPRTATDFATKALSS
jgi:hypothetical protein